MGLDEESASNPHLSHTVDYTSLWICNAPATFQRLIEVVLADLLLSALPTLMMCWSVLGIFRGTSSHYRQC